MNLADSPELARSQGASFWSTFISAPAVLDGEVGHDPPAGEAEGGWVSHLVKQHEQEELPCRSGGWAGSPATSAPTAAKPNVPLPWAERLGSVNAAQELGTTWPSLRKGFARHGLGMPARNPEAVRQRATAATRKRIGQSATPALDPVFAALNPGALPARPRPPAKLYQWVRRDEEDAILGANLVVELNSQSRARHPTTRAWAIIRRADHAH